MKHLNHLARTFAVGVGVLALFGAGTASATTPPSEPTGDSTAATNASDCPTIPAATETSAPGTAAAGPATSEAAAAGTQPTGTDAAMTPFLQVAQSEEFGEILVDSQCRARVRVHAGRRWRADVCRRLCGGVAAVDRRRSDGDVLPGLFRSGTVDRRRPSRGHAGEIRRLAAVLLRPGHGVWRRKRSGCRWRVVAGRPGRHIDRGWRGATGTSAPAGSMPTDTTAADTAVATTGG